MFRAHSTGDGNFLILFLTFYIKRARYRHLTSVCSFSNIIWNICVFELGEIGLCEITLVYFQRKSLHNISFKTFLFCLSGIL